MDDLGTARSSSERLVAARDVDDHVMPRATNSSDKRKRRREQHDEKRAEIIKATRRLLFRYGHRAGTMEEIANASGIGTASLYKYFPEGRDQLYDALIDSVLALDEEALNRAFDSGETPVDELIAVGQAYVGFALEHPGAFQFLATPKAFGSLTDEQVEHMASRVSRLVGRVAKVIERGQSRDLPEAQRISEHLDPMQTAEVLHGAWNGLLGLSVREDALERKNEHLIQLAAVATDIVQNGMMSRRLDQARAVALDMALARSSRAAIDAALSDRFSVSLDDVLNARIVE
jgi:AcrR family transcriptional regulator